MDDLEDGLEDGPGVVLVVPVAESFLVGPCDGHPFEAVVQVVVVQPFGVVVLVVADLVVVADLAVVADLVVVVVRVVVVAALVFDHRGSSNPVAGSIPSIGQSNQVGLRKG